MIASFYIFMGTLVLFAVLGALGIGVGYLRAKAKERAFLKVFNEDVAKPVLPRGVS